MAQRKRKTPVKKKSKRAFLERAGIAALKGSGSAAAGASIGVVEEAVGERAALGTKAVLAAAGLASEILVDPETHPIVSEMGKASLHSAAAVTGYQAGKAATKKAKKVKHEREHQQMLDRLKADMAADDEAPDKAKKPETAKVKKPLAKAKPAVGDEA